MPKVKKKIEDYYGSAQYKKNIKIAETTKFHNVSIPTLSKPELMAIIGELIFDVNNHIDHIERLETAQIEMNNTIDNLNDTINSMGKLNDLSNSIDVVDSSFDELIENNKADTLVENVIESIGNVGSLTGDAPIEEHEKVFVKQITKTVTAEALNVGPFGSHQYNDWN